MGIFRQFPYTNFHDLNEDWIIGEVKRLASEWIEYNKAWEDLYNNTNEAVANAIEKVDELNNRVDTIQTEITRYIRNYFDNLDLTPEVSAKIDNLVANGTVGNIILEKVSPFISQWLNDNITEPVGVVIDKTLSIEGACADAKATGDLARASNNQILDMNYYDLLTNRAQPERTYNGVTYHWLGKNCKLTGTASPFSFCNLIFSTSEMPTDFSHVIGKNILLNYETIDGGTPTSTLQVIFYNGGTNIKSVALRGWQLIEVPANADGVVVRIAVNSGDSVNETVKMALYTATPIEIINNYVKPIRYIDRLADNFNLNDIDYNTIGIDTGNCINAPVASAGFVYTVGRLSVTQIWIQFNNADMYYRRKTINNNWSEWIAMNQQDDNPAGNPNAKMFSVGNSILNGAVYKNGSLDHLASYGNAPYSIIANAMNVPRANVQNELHSSTGVLYDAGEGNFVDNILNKNLSAIDVVVTHFWTRDMDYNIGNLNSPASMVTLVGAIKTILNYIKSQNKNTQFVLIGVPPCSTSIKGDEVFTGIYPNGKSIHDLNVIMKELASLNHFIFVDWEDLNISYYYQDLTDGSNVHANNDATYKMMGSYVAGRVSSNITF